MASSAELSEVSFKRIKKAKKVVVDMVATIVFYLLAIRAKVEALSLTPEVEEAVFENFIPAIYLHLVSEKTKCGEVRQQLRRKSEELLEPLRAVNGPFSGLASQGRRSMEGGTRRGRIDGRRGVRRGAPT